ncbi:MAG: hypothetical protein KIS87_02795 [Phycisphaeraceae bacterium]|nr:hypothetical protein [Phycisphaeraceae bacterium]
MATIREFMDRLERDPWRVTHPFEASVNDANERLFACTSAAKAEAVLNEWLASNQPCLFGRSAARQGLLSHCVLFEPDLLNSDTHIRDAIQAARTEWTRRGFNGERSGFVVSAISPRLAYAKPGAILKAIAQRLCSLYLLDEVECDRVYLDDLFLQAPGHNGRVWRWRAGVNYFAANGDGRWWQDHRMPGGIAFSVNSVGHMARSGAIAKLLKDGAGVLGLDSRELPATPVDSLDKALLVAMQTIAGASQAVSGKATMLRPLAPDAAAARRCPAHFPAKLQAFDRCEYDGFYHTDYTLPTEYFDDAAERPAHVRQWSLDFTYLSDAGVNNPAGVAMGTGQVIKAPFDGPWREPSSKRERAAGELIDLAAVPRLRDALARAD